MTFFVSMCTRILQIALFFVVTLD